MSEYTDYYAVRVADPASLVAGLTMAGAKAVVFDNLVDTDKRPVWVAIALFTDAAALVRLGPAIHVRLDEEQHCWQLGVVTGQGARYHTFFDRPFWWGDREGDAPDGFAPVAAAPPAENDAAVLVATFGVSWAALAPTLAAGGFEAFCAATGVPCCVMLDQTIRIPEPGGVVSAADL